MSTRLAHNTLHSAIAGLCVMLGGFVSNVLVARLLGIEASGIVAFATWAITVGVMLGDLGAPGSLARYIPDLHARGLMDAAQGLVRWLFGRIFTAATIILVGFLGYALWCLLSESGAAGASAFRADPQFWLLVAAACFAQTLAAFVNGYLKGMQRFSALARLAAISAVVQIATTCAGGLYFGALGALTGAIAGSLAPLVLLPRLMAERQANLPPDLRQRVRHFSLESWAGYLVTAFAWARMEIFFLELTWGSHAVAFFAISVTLANLATQGPLLLTGGLLPHLSRQSALQTGRRPQETYAVAIRVLAFLIFPACLGAAAISPSLVPAIYGADFAGAVPSTAILLCGAAVTASSSVAFTYMLAMERTRFVFVTGGVAALLVVAVGVTLIPTYGLIAAAIARATIQATVSIATVCYLWRVLDCPTPIGALLRLFASATLCALAAFACVTAVPGIPGLALAIPTGALVYAVAVRLLRAMPKQDAQPLFNALAILPWPIRIPAVTTLRLIAA